VVISAPDIKEREATRDRGAKEPRDSLWQDSQCQTCRFFSTKMQCKAEGGISHPTSLKLNFQQPYSMYFFIPNRSPSGGSFQGCAKTSLNLMLDETLQSFSHLHCLFRLGRRCKACLPKHREVKSSRSGLHFSTLSPVASRRGQLSQSLFYG
jgi:hypothetical protein